MKTHHVDLSNRVIGAETLDHLTDGELLARASFKPINQLGRKNDSTKSK